MLVRSGLVAAVAGEGIAWLRASESGIREQTHQHVLPPDAIASCALQRNQELAVLGSDGSLTRVRQAVQRASAKRSWSGTASVF